MLRSFHLLLLLLLSFALLRTNFVTGTNCNTKSNCKECVKSTQCIWCDGGSKGGDSSFCLNGDIKGKRNGGNAKNDTICENWYWGQCGVDGKLFKTDYTYIIIIILLCLLIIALLAIVAFLCYRKMKKREAVAEIFGMQDLFRQNRADLPLYIDSQDDDSDGPEPLRHSNLYHGDNKKTLEQLAIEPLNVTEVDKDCIICFEAPKNTVLIPCGHLVLCLKCARGLKLSNKLCPVCRSDIESVYRAYYS